MQIEFIECPEGLIGVEALTYPQVHFRATGTAEVMELRKYIGLDRIPADPEEIVKWSATLQATLAAGEMTHEKRSTAKRCWLQVDVDLPTALDPYVFKLQSIFGVFPLLPDELDLTPMMTQGWGTGGKGTLLATHITRRLGIVGGAIQADVLVQVDRDGWNRMDAETYASRNAHDYVQASIGDRKSEPEYLENGHGQARKNPNWTKHHMAHPACKSAWLFDILAQHVLETQASDAQKSVLSRRVGLNHVKLMDEYQFYYEDPNGTVHWDDKGTKVAVMSIQQFAELANT